MNIFAIQIKIIRGSISTFLRFTKYFYSSLRTLPRHFDRLLLYQKYNDVFPFSAIDAQHIYIFHLHKPPIGPLRLI